MQMQIPSPNSTSCKYTYLTTEVPFFFSVVVTTSEARARALIYFISAIFFSFTIPACLRGWMDACVGRQTTCFIYVDFCPLTLLLRWALTAHALDVRGR